MRKPLFKIKVCGVRTIDDAQMLVDKGVDAIGLNFYQPSTRSIDLDIAKEIAEHLDDKLLKVGLFVNASLTEIEKTIGQVGLDAIQIHGDESPEFLAELPQEIPLIRAFRVGESGLNETQEYLEACSPAGRIPDMVLIDAASKGAYGGTGKQVDWERLKSEKEVLGDAQLALAGGIAPTNVAEAIRIVEPDAIDTASGVETSPGVKDATMTELLVSEARRAFAS